MSCEDCESMQEMNMKGINTAYIRIGNSNIMIGACDKHFNKLQEQLGIGATIVHRITDLK